MTVPNGGLQELDLRYLGMATYGPWLDQAVKMASSPTFAGLHLTAFSGFLLATAGAISARSLQSSDIPNNAADTTGKAANITLPDVTNIRKFLRILSVGGVTQVPVWDTLLVADVPTLNQDTTGKAANLAFGSDAQDDVPVRGASVYGRLSIGEQTLLGRITGGHVAALSVTQIKALLALVQADVTGLHTGDSPTFAGATIGSLAGIVKATAGVLSAQALGAADLKLFMNAAGTGIEWFGGFYVGSLTRDMTATSSTAHYTGLGFKPLAILTISGINAIAAMSIGFQATSYVRAEFFGGVLYIDTAEQINCIVDGANLQRGHIGSYDVDGFSIVWTKVGAPTGTGTVIYIAFR